MLQPDDVLAINSDVKMGRVFLIIYFATSSTIVPTAPMSRIVVSSEMFAVY